MHLAVTFEFKRFVYIFNSDALTRELGTVDLSPYLSIFYQLNKF
jgi:hypothetical protein